MKYDLESFGKRLLDLIEKRYLTQSEMSRITKIGKANVSLYCNGKKKASPQTIVKICRCLDCAPDWLIHGKGTIDDTFQESVMSNIERMEIKNRIVATSKNNFIDVTFSIPKNDFRFIMKDLRVFMNNAQKEGYCE